MIDGKEYVVVQIPNPNVIPLDLGVTLNTESYFNYNRMLENAGIKIKRFLFSKIPRSMITDAFHFKMEKPFLGLWREPRKLMQLLEFKKLMRFIDRDWDKAIHEKYPKGTANETTARLIADFRWKGSLLQELAITYFSFLTGVKPRTFINEFSAKHLYDWIRQAFFEGKMSKRFAHEYGTTVSIQQMKQTLLDKGVTVKVNSTEEGENTVYAFHPWQLTGRNFEYFQVPVYLHSIPEAFYIGKNATVVYARSDSKSIYINSRVDSLKPNYAEHGLFAIYGITGEDANYESMMEESAKKASMKRRLVTLDEYQGEGFDEVTLKVVHEHAKVTPAFEQARVEIQELQGVDNKWYVSASLDGPCRHESAVTSALNTVILMKGADAYHQLIKKGYQPGLSKKQLASIGIHEEEKVRI